MTAAIGDLDLLRVSNTPELKFLPHLTCVGDVVSAIGAKDTFDGSAQGKSPCEDVVNKGLVDKQEEGRIGVQVERLESEVVISSEGK